MSVENFGKKAKETTAAYPDALSFATMKAEATSKMISLIECALVNIPLKSGCSSKHWKNFIDVMILKKSGATNWSGLCTVVLFSVDCNFAFKNVGRKMMQIAESTRSLAKDQYGSRKRHRAVDLKVNKTLTYDILRQLKRPGAICSNDAKSCYDLIGNTKASLAMQWMGAPRSFVDCLFMTLQQGQHKVCTGYGDSQASYNGKLFLVPIPGIY
jgi:hypothetical protein